LRKDTRQELSNLYRCSLIGLVPQKDIQILVDRLSGLCEDHERVKNSPWRIREIVFSRAAEPTGSIPERSELRVQCTQSEDENNADTPKVWSLLYEGLPLQDNNLLAFARPVIEVEVSDSIETFLEEMGYTYRYEFVKRGLRFHALPDKHGLNPLYVTVYLYWKLSDKNKRGDQEVEPLLQDGLKEWVVEVFGYALHADLEDMTRELHSFANRLIPIVNLIKLDKGTVRSYMEQIKHKKNLVQKQQQQILQQQQQQLLQQQQQQMQQQQDATKPPEEEDDEDDDDDDDDDDEHTN